MSPKIIQCRHRSQSLFFLLLQMLPKRSRGRSRKKMRRKPTQPLQLVQEARRLSYLLLLSSKATNKTPFPAQTSSRLQPITSSALQKDQHLSSATPEQPTSPSQLVTYSAKAHRPTTFSLKILEVICLATAPTNSSAIKSHQRLAASLAISSRTSSTLKATKTGQPRAKRKAKEEN